MKTKITKYILTFVIIVFGIASWSSVERAINVPTSSTWLVPIIFFTIFFVGLSLGAILIKEKVILFSALAISFFTSLFFTFSFWHIGVIIFSFFVAMLATEKMRKDVTLNIKVDLQKSIRTGKAILILALAIVTTSQYYFETKDTPKANIIPKMETGALTGKILPIIYPNLKNNSKDDLTVDEFILEMSKENSNSILSSFLENPENSQIASMIGKEGAQKINNVNQNVILLEGRKNLENIAGTKLTGQEKISDVFSDMISSRMNEIFSPALTEDNRPIVSAVSALILFLTIISLGPFLGFVAIYLAVSIFWLMRKADLVKISKVMMEVERVE